MTGAPIKVGDLVYRPKQSTSSPANRDFMILAKMVHDNCAEYEGS
ncbi:DUF3331 domain-containing protein [Caballeronia arationis]|nr:DUF3331 domain-containing protein [Caballeronia arationis]